ncbi:TetR/AcrR family transcriptional regulator [Paenibacillus methanolicus]|uniref:AcrR family transcriptional regulator n=1 Tax=Paenibacillus methanolicus TaxID=582686 RepID=A0A5S5C6F9_9BACL|nr:TetR/AcrR family transcriptional regulator [Paenibacillus methanolicus]TYP73976.1 AcrR family transcriptional regulator [Paenibacillus methanolicus]
MNTAVREAVTVLSWELSTPCPAKAKLNSQVIAMPQKLDPNKETRILEAADELFAHYGFGKTTIEEIAGAAEIAKGTIYLYFKNKKQILVRLVMRTLLDAQHGAAEELSGESEPDRRIRSAIERKALDLFRFTQRYPDALEILAMLRKEEIREQGGETYFGRHAELLREAFEAGTRDGLYRIGDVNALVYHVCFVTQAFDPPYKGISSEDELRGHIGAYVDMLLAAIQSKEAIL